MKIKLKELVGKIVCRTSLDIPEEHGQFPRVHWKHVSGRKIRQKDAIYQYTTIKESPHLAFVRGNKTPYRDYMNTEGWVEGYGPERKRACENFQKLVDSFEEYDPKIKSIEVVEENDGYSIVDGLHRCSILYNRDPEMEVEVKVIKCPVFKNLKMNKK